MSVDVLILLKIVRKIATVALHSVNRRSILNIWYFLPSEPDGRTYQKLAEKIRKNFLDRKARRHFPSIWFLFDFLANFWYVLPSGSDGRMYHKWAVGLLLSECSAGGVYLCRFFKSTSTDINTSKQQAIQRGDTSTNTRIVITISIIKQRLINRDHDHKINSEAMAITRSIVKQLLYLINRDHGINSQTISIDQSGSQDQ